MVVREAREKNGVEVLCQDLLLAFEDQDLMLQWQFRDGGEFKGPLTVGANRVLLTGSKGEVFQFR